MDIGNPTPTAPSTSDTSSAPAPSATTPSAPSGGGGVVRTPQNPASSSGRTLSGQVNKPTEPVGGDAPAGETAAEKALRLKLKYKVDGEEIEEELDEHEIRMRVQKGRGAEKRFEEAARMRKQFEDAVALGKRDPAAAMKQLFDLDLDSWAEQRLEEKFQDALLPEAEREKRQLQKELENYKRQAEEQKAAQENERRTAQERHVFQETEAQFLEAFKASGLDPQYARTVVMPLAADVALAALKQGLDLSPQDAIKEANKRLNKVAQNATKGLKGDSLLKFLGDDVVKEVLRARIASAKVPSPPPAPVQPREEFPERVPARKRMSPDEFRRKHLFGI